MFFGRTLALSCLLASAVLAHSPDGQRQSLPLNHLERSSNVVYNSGWAGAARTEGPGTIRYVEGIFVVPHVSGPIGTSGTAWVGIDGSSCKSAIFGTGLHFVPGKPPQARFEWFPDQSVAYPGFSVAAGDRIKVSVTAYSATKGLAKIINLSNGKYAEQHVSSSHALCMQDAEWIFEDFSSGDTAVDFGTITFEDAKARSHDGKFYEAAGGTLYYTQRDGKLLTTVSTHGDSVTVHRV